jgi:hypothetical protein
MAEFWMYAALVLGGLAVGGGAAHPEVKRTAREAVNTVKDALPRAPKVPVRNPPGAPSVTPSNPNAPKPKPISSAPLPVLGKPASSFALPAKLERHRSAIQKASARNGVRPTLLAAVSHVMNPDADAGLAMRDASFEALITAKKLKIARSWTVRDAATRYGFCQLRGYTFALYGFTGSLYQCLETGINYEYAARHLKNLLTAYSKVYGKDAGEYYALVAYHGGDAAVQAALSITALFGTESVNWAKRVQAEEKRFA